MPLYGKGYTGTNVVAAESEKEYVYSDFFLAFKPSTMFLEQGLSGDIIKKYDSESVKQSVRQIVLTNKYERPWKPNFGCNVRASLFESMASGWLQFDLSRRIREQLSRWEPRVSVQDVIIREDPTYNSLSV